MADKRDAGWAGGDDLATKILEALGLGDLPVCGLSIDYETGEVADVTLRTYWPMADRFAARRMGGETGRAGVVADAITAAVRDAVGEGMPVRLVFIGHPEESGEAVT